MGDWGDFSVLYGMSAVHMRPLQNVLNSAARVVTKFQHITAAVRDQLHWLPVKQRVEFKHALFVYKVLRQTAPPYLVDMCQPVSTSSTRRHLRSAAHGDFVELRCRTTRYGKRSFPASAPLIWNSLPTAVRDVSTSLTSFSRRLKAEMFRRAYGTDFAPM